ncbi:MAG: capsule assembly Wzi family protein [Bacteroidia bacterium]|nr:capsule assembly Wzi family protein [Bacteroidia bacterium]
MSPKTETSGQLSQYNEPNHHRMKHFFVLLFVLAACSSRAQQSVSPLNFEWMQETEAEMVRNRGLPIPSALRPFIHDPQLQSIIAADSSVMLVMPVHTSMKPWIENGLPVRKTITLNNAHQKQAANGPGFGNWLKRWHYQSSLLQVERPSKDGEPFFNLYIDPLFNLQAGSATDSAGSGTFWINTRGVTARGDIGRRVSFETSFLENQAMMPEFIDAYARKTLVIPGQGRWKTFDTTGFDYSMASGYVSVAAAKWLNIQAGHGKHFVGDGYRSLLLSDNSFNYPFARITAQFGKQRQFQFTSLYAVLTNLQSVSPVPPGIERLFQKKPASFQMLSWRPARILELGFFQGVMWNAADSANRVNTGFLFWNPLPGIGPAAEGMNSTRNYMLGLNLRVDILKTASLYGQFMLDNLGNNSITKKMGWQAGLKSFNTFTIKHLYIQAEYNRVMPYTYATTDAAQSWTHYGQPLAHPLGAGFSEFTGSLQYKIGDFFVHVRATSATIEANTNGQNFGQWPFLSDNTATTLLPSATRLNYIDARIGWMISYASNLNVSAGLTARNVTSNSTNNAQTLFSVALRTSLSNIYYDFF